MTDEDIKERIDKESQEKVKETMREFQQVEAHSKAIANHCKDKHCYNGIADELDCFCPFLAHDEYDRGYCSLTCSTMCVPLEWWE